MPDMSFDPTDELHCQKVAFFEIEHEDVFHLKNLYKMIFEWFGMHKFVSVDNNDSNIETLYFEKILQNGNKEHHIWWRTHNIPDNNKYYKYYLKFDYQTLNMGKHKVTHKGQQISTNSGDLILRCEAYLILDYQKTWRNHWFLKNFENLFIKRWYKAQIDFLKTDLWIKTYKLQDAIKQYMKLKNPSEMPKPFHPELGL